MERVILKPELSFSQWLAKKGIPADSLASDNDLANLIGGMFAERTKAGRGKLKAPAARIAETQRLTAEYEAEIASGKIAMLEERVPLHPESSAADAAYIRAQEHRRLLVASRDK